jgi:DNA-binding transcriptional regulator YdaS (Cro superfamily)
MECIRTYLNSLPVAKQEQFASRCGTTLGYLRKALSTGEDIRESVVINMERESKGAIRCEEVRTDVDWAVLRGKPRARVNSRA